MGDSVGESQIIQQDQTLQLHGVNKSRERIIDNKKFVECDIAK